jgi:hypothetical protein
VKHNASEADRSGIRLAESKQQQEIAGLAARLGPTSANTLFHAAPRRSARLAAAGSSIQFRSEKVADMPAPCFARLRHVVNSRDVSRNAS